MNKLKTTILSLCLILIGVSVILGVNAVDNNTIVFNETNNTANSINTTNNGVVVSNATTFKELQQDINKYDNIELAHDIKRDGSQTIEINKNVTIDGCGHTIDGEQARIFIITRTGNLILKNIILTNGYSDKGGAISNQGSLTITNSILKNNVAGLECSDGGAIDNYGVLAIINSTFTNNKANGNGGAIDNDGTLTITGSTFTNNTAGNCGGAIDNYDKKSIITDSIFTNNTAGNCGGAIITREGTLTITGSTFTNNTAGNCGGAILNEGGKITIIKSSFKDNNRDDSKTIINSSSARTEIKNSSINGKFIHYKLLLEDKSIG